MSKRPVSFTKPSPGRSTHAPLSGRQRRHQIRDRLHLPRERAFLFGRSLVNGEDMLIAGTVFLVTFVGAGAWLAI